MFYIGIIINTIPGTALVAVALAAVVLCFLTVILYIIKSGKQKKLERKFKIIDSVKQIKGIKKPEDKYDEILKLISGSIKGDGYFLYLRKFEDDKHRLKRVLFEQNPSGKQSGGVDIGYGRIIPYAKEAYAPPLSFTPADIPKKTTLLMEGRFSLLVIPVMNQRGFISVSTKKKRFRGGEFFDYVASCLEDTFEEISGMDTDENKIFEKKENEDEKEPCEKLMEFILKVMHADAGYFFKIEYDYCELLADAGFSIDISELLHNDTDMFSDIEQVSRDQNSIIIREGSRDYEKIPSYIKEEGFGYIVIKKMKQGIMVLCSKEESINGTAVEYRSNAAKILSEKIVEESKSGKSRRSSEYYMKKIRSIAHMIDREEPFSEGYSDLMKHYTTAICREMKLSPEETSNYETAAYLSNIGVLVLRSKILYKEGVFTEKEYDSIKLHSTEGAKFVQMLTGNEVIARCIRYHHERIDGMGYPEGLSGDEIPLGARILAVVQTFLSKIKGRNYREPLSFEKIILLMKKEAGNSLDSKIVDSLINWFRKKQQNPVLEGQTLGTCWEMRCASEDICKNCPAYKRTDRYCWTFENNNCLAHGNSCDTCFIRTEFIKRKDVLEMEAKEKGG